MRRIILAIIISVLIIPQSRADEGMWLLPLIKQLNIKDMKKAGFKLSAEDVYSINSSSIKDAIVIFGGGCTGEIISNQGLLLTNHHCGYGAIQQHSSVEHDYLKDGFWARNKSEEIPTPGLSVQFLESIEDVSSQIIPLVKDLKAEPDRARKVSELSAEITTKATSGKERYLRASVVSMFGGNEYYLVVYKVYSDVRMVGAPPSSIGKFGADTDNWMWPRHTGDFSLFRVYSDKNGYPAEYSVENVPLKPKHYLPISTKGFSEGDFAMVMGFPGSTQRYMTSWEVLERMNIDNANRIKIRGIRQDLMMEDMRADPKVNIQYATKHSGSSNYWKNSIGMNNSLTKKNVVEQKRMQETQFKNWIGNNAERQALYGDALSLIESAVMSRGVNNNAIQYLSESVTRGSEIIGFASGFISLYNQMKNQANQADSALLARLKNRTEQQLRQSSENFFKNYSQPTDRKITSVMLKLYYDDVPAKDRADIFEEINKEYNGDFEKYTSDLFSKTFLLDATKLKAFLENPTTKALEEDIAFKIALSASSKTTELQRENVIGNLKYTEGHRKYVAGLMQMYNGVKPIYPDANFTMRLTYGKIAGYNPADATHFDYVTTLSGVIEKEDPNNWEFEVPAKLKQLYQGKDYGQYSTKDGQMPVNFIFGGDITGGNSGSPVLNAKGQLIGTAFDGNWEAMSGDIAFENEMQRCINVDIRYTLFIIDKFADARYLIDEMTIVK